MLDHNLEYYRAFYYVAKLGNITKAAQALYISQPAVSRQIQELEKSLNAALFKRTPRGVALTAEGRLLFAHVEAAFGHLSAGAAELQDYQKYTAGTIKIAATETAFYYFLLDKVAKFKQISNTAFQISGSSTADTLKMVRENAADLAVAVSPVENVADLTVVSVKTFRDIFVAGIDENFSALKNGIFTAEEIAKYPIITVESGTSARTLIDRYFDELGIFFKPTITVRTSTAVLPFVERNLGVGIIPFPFAEGKISDGEIFEVQAEKPLYEREILIIYREKTPTIEHFLEFLI